MLGRAPGKLGAVATTAEIAKAVGMPARNVSRALAEWVAARRVRRLARVGRRVPYEGRATRAEMGSP
jgi:alkylated DNA nucleotide flippase Atl1